MARARIVHYWPEGGKTLVEIDVESSYPDALDEARMQVLRLYRETCTEAADEHADGEPE